MRLLPISMARPGMRLGKAILSEEGQTLLGFRVELTRLLIDRLKQMGYEQLYIEDSRTDDITMNDPLSEETRTLLRQCLTRMFLLLQRSAGLTPASDLQILSRMSLQCVRAVIDDLQANRRPGDETIMLMDMNRRNFTPVDHFYQNAINLCVYATYIGLLEKFGRADLETIALGALLHDIGNTQVSPKLLQKASSLTPIEYAEVQKHTEYGYTMLRETPGIPLIAAHCALQHHEKHNGSGYPAGLSDRGIHPYAQWIGLLDAYDAMTNPRPYRPALPPDHALEILFIEAGTSYDMSKVAFFRNTVAIFPVGLSVKLSTGETGVVSRINTSAKHRPVVRVLSMPNGEDVQSPYEVDLSRHLHIMIHRISEDSL